MKRWVVSLAVLLGGIGGLGYADYIEIIANLGLSKSPMDPGQSPPERPPLSGILQPGQPMAPEELPDEPLDVRVVVEVKVVNPATAGGGIIRVNTKYGATFLINSNTIKIVVANMPDGRPRPTVAQRFYEKYTKDLSRATKHEPEEYLKVAEWALAHGLHIQREMPAMKPGDPAAKSDPHAMREDKVALVMRDMERAHKDHPSVVAFCKVMEALGKPAAQGDSLRPWKEELFKSYREAQSPHYSLLHLTPNSQPETEVKSRLARLEDNYRAFFYWFALKGLALTPPGQRLPAVLLPRPDDFQKYHKVFDGVPHIADGFYSHRDHLLVLASSRTDDQYGALLNATKPLWQVFDREDLLKGKIPRVANKTGEEIADASTKALLLRALEEDAELATISHEASRQLLCAVGLPDGPAREPLVPNAVAVPEWVQFGMGSFFETPKGSFWPGTGAPNYHYLELFKKWKTQKKLEPAPVALKNVVSDRNFRAAAVAGDKDRPPALLKARTMSWALSYYLAQKKLDGLFRYFQELARLPRDLELDEATILNCFARSFGLTDPANPNAVDEKRLAAFANEWIDAIQYTPSEDEEIRKEIRKAKEPPAKP